MAATPQNEQFQYAKLPDGSYAKFKAGVSEADMRKQLEAKGLLKPKASTGDKVMNAAFTGLVPPKAIEPLMDVETNRKQRDAAIKAGDSKEAFWRAFDTGIGEDLAKFASGLTSIGGAAMTVGSMIPALRVPTAIAAGALGGKQISEGSSLKDIAKQTSYAVTGGDVPSKLDDPSKAGPEHMQSTLMGGSMILGSASLAKAGLPTPEGLRTRAQELNTKVLKTATAGKEDMGMSTALQVAQEGIISNAKDLPNKIEAARKTKEVDIKRAAIAHDVSGRRIDVQRTIGPIVSQTANLLNQRGVLIANSREIKSFMDQLTQKVDPQTGQTVPRNLNAMTASEIIELTKHDGLLSDTAQFTKTRPDAVNNLARRLRAEFEKQLPDSINIPRREEGNLIKARDAAKENYEKILNDRVSFGKSLLYGSAGVFAVYESIRLLGVNTSVALATVMTLRAIGQSTRSRTLRAAAYAKAADLIDGGVRRNALGAGSGTVRQPGQGPTGPQTPPQGPQGAPMPGLGPQAAQVPAAQQLRGQIGPQPGQQPTATTPKVAPSTVVSTNAPSAPTLGGPGISRGLRLPATGEPGVTRVAEGVSGALPEVKGMMDRLDALYERQAKPKSGADRVAIEREIKQIKDLIQKKSSPTETAKAKKQIADRERLASKRATAAAETTVAENNTSVAAAQSSAPDTTMILKERAYAALSKHTEGKELAKTLRSTAKSLKWDSATEIQALTEALEFLRSADEGKLGNTN